MTLNKNQIEVAEKVARLLAESPLDSRIKEALLEDFDKIPEHLIIKLLEMLESEAKQLDVVVKEIDDFKKKQDKNWANLEKDQKALADSIVEKHLKKLEEEAKNES